MLHGLWSPGAGLMLWDDEISTGDEPDLPPTHAHVLTRPFRHRAAVSFPAPGRSATAQAPVQVPAIALAPHDGADLLLRTPSEHASISGDLRYLAHVARGIERWVRGGRVVPALKLMDGQWWPRWRLVGGERQRAWLSELAVAMPSVQRAGERPKKILDDMVEELTDPIVRSVLGRPDSEHPLLSALIRDDPYVDGTQQMSTLLDNWRASLTVDEPSLVLRLLEPDDDDGVVDSSSEESAESFWTLQVCLRADGEAPRPVPMSRKVDATLLSIAVRKLGEAVAAYPRLRDLPSQEGTLDLLLPTSVVIDLVEHGATALQATGTTVLLPRAWTRLDPSMRLRVDSPAVTKAAADRAVGMDELVSYDWQLQLGDMVLTEAEMNRLAVSKGDLVRLRGQWVLADGGQLARAAKYVAEHHGDGTALSTLMREMTLADPPPAPVQDIRATGWAATLLEPGAVPETIPVPAGVNATLRPYQQRGLDWLAFMSRLGLGAVLADDMGLGKTLQVLTLLAHEKSSTPTLLVAPMSVVGNWQREAAKFTPALRVLVHHGPARSKGDELDRAIAEHDLIVTTYALMAKDRAQLSEQTWRRVVLDEAQHIKNSGTVQAKAALAIPADHKLALTGTPVENRLDELRSILDFANPGMLGRPSDFRKRFSVPIERENDESAVSRLRAITSPFILRRVKTDPTVISDLPEKNEMTVRANLTAEQAALYKAVVDEMMAQIADAKGMKRKGAVLSALTRLKQVCNHPAHFLSDGSPVLKRGQHRSGKIGLVEDMLDSILGDNEKALLFTQFREFGELVAPYFAERFGTDLPFLHGGVSKSKRDEMVEKFQSGNGPPIMMLSLKAGGTGLNLTAANHVVHLDRWWNPAVENQATDRAFRIGQRKNVEVRKLLCVGTVEERIDSMLVSKQDLANLAVGTGENWVTEMDTAELQELFRLSEDAVGE
ncbi:ATP-dependent helicase [Rhodococcus sp. 15-725-2-2b]|uniref:DEAD/DEAH box helicase n=1 Tax=unclassified Rhodococcus (in: high G+C Gram-positive bacteria) TaxID=192944 RepID=UPI0005D9259B|nr:MULTISPECIES: DEAD/DEAH box helicase [unclassified Rhodococcus (in: high G+C Gram-positive bacteria)]AJW38260.1 Helicase, SNF2/RAD54 [Rhodococcus sp. B7740]OZC56080.1 ATP-dependent helicase [Rhodococcus sp. 06-470-2]OZC65935.1 ATP-dependent helicase [Rhodococcus sp. 06-469-3-2]OZC74190.1 ATP-dependent helicase [Rhodococcus sp. 06-418-5]OZD41788.1 ATP-dependent helicase [Rhodococcus sp. 06-1477-1A]